MSTPTPPSEPSSLPQITVDHQIGYRQGIASGHWNLAMLHKRQGERADARREMLQALTGLEELGDQRGVEDARTAK